MPVARAQQPAQQPSPAETEARLRDLRRQISLDEDRLARAKEAEDVTVSTLTDVERQIASREALVSTYGLRVDQLRTEQDSLSRAVATLTNDLLRLRAQYRVRSTYLYKYGRLGDLALLFSARSFNEMVRRARLLRRFSDDGQRRYASLERLTIALQQRQQRISAAQQQQGKLLQDASAEQNSLRGLQAMRLGVVNQLRTQRETLETEVTRKQEAARAFEMEVRRTVAGTVARRRSSSTPADEATYAALTGAFTDAQGRLPWPAVGAVSEGFGRVVNQQLGTEIVSPGVIIATAPQAPVRAVFGGTVVKIDLMAEYGTYVLVSHGAYLTCYANLSLISGLHVNDPVRPGQQLGLAGTDAQPRGAALFFAVFNGSRPVDPLQWLRDE